MLKNRIGLNVPAPILVLLHRWKSLPETTRTAINFATVRWNSPRQDQAEENPLTQLPNPGLPPQAALMQIVYGPIVARMVAAMAELGVPDLLASQPRTVEALAATLELNPGALGRMLRALAGIGFVTIDETLTFRNGPVAELLRTDTPGSMRDYVIYAASLPLFQAWDRVLEVLRTGEPAFRDALGMDFWDYGRAHPQFGARFDRAMTSLGSGAARALLGAAGARFSQVHTVVDVGGGQGLYLAGILQELPSLRGVLFDLPDVVAGASESLDRAGVRDRIEVVGGDMFAAVPPGGDLYLMKTVLHDWDDDRASAVLASCRTVMGPGSALWLIEVVLPDGPEPHPARFQDLHMMVVLGGRERTEGDWRALLAVTEFELTEVIPLPGPQSIVVAHPRWPV